jgi:hypothetical protein
MSAGNTLKELSVCKKIILVMPAFRTAKPIWPSELKEMLATSAFIVKSALELQ